MQQDVHHFINGKRVTGSGQRHDLKDPRTNQVSKQVAYANTSDVDLAVQAAKAALPGWAATTPNKRAQVMFRFKQLLESHRDKLAHLVMEEHGKTIADAQASVKRGLDVVDYACNLPNALKSDFVSDVSTGIDCHSLRQPIGICVGITPFNFPVMIPLWMFPIAIACGNTFILKPSERDPSVSVKLAELMQAADLPDGILNVVQGDHLAVDALITHPDVSAVSFVGSSLVAKHVHQTASLHHKRVQAFAGAKNHCVVMPDANIEHAANAIFGAAYGSAGERCMAISVAVTVGEQTGDRLAQQLKNLAPTLRLGSGDDPKADIGPLVTHEHLQRVLSYIDQGVNAGAKLIVDGRENTPVDFPQGNFLGPCLFDQVSPDMSIYQDEIFGPVLCIVRVPDFAGALNLINDNSYGNGTGIFTNDARIAREFARQVQVGMVGINIPIPVPTSQLSFGGWKNSIYADIHMHGTEGVQFYTKLKTITTTWPEKTAAPEFRIPTGD